MVTSPWLGIVRVTSMPLFSFSVAAQSLRGSVVFLNQQQNSTHPNNSVFDSQKESEEKVETKEPKKEEKPNTAEKAPAKKKSKPKKVPEKNKVVPKKETKSKSTTKKTVNKEAKK